MFPCTGREGVHGKKRQDALRIPQCTRSATYVMPKLVVTPIGKEHSKVLAFCLLHLGPCSEFRGLYLCYRYFQLVSSSPSHLSEHPSQTSLPLLLASNVSGWLLGSRQQSWSRGNSSIVPARETCLHQTSFLWGMFFLHPQVLSFASHAKQSMALARVAHGSLQHAPVMLACCVSWPLAIPLTFRSPPFPSGRRV